MNKFAILGLVGCLAGCQTNLKSRWASPAQLKVPKKHNFKKAPAAYLLREVRALMVDTKGPQEYSQWQYHNVLAILNEKGFEYADVRVPYHEKAKIVDFAARTIGPNGRMVIVNPKKVYDDEAKGDEDRRYKVRVFAFPQVKVGSVLEYRYTIEYPWIPSYLDNYINASIPVKKYVVALEGTQEVRFAVRAYNVKKGTKPWVVGTRGDRWTVDWTLTDIPAKRSYSFAGSRELRDPFWAFSIRQYEWGGNILPINRDWNSAVRRQGRKLYAERQKWFEGFTERPDYQTAKTPRQKLERMLAFLTQEFPYRSQQRWPGRKARQIQASREASGIEKTRLLYEWLTAEGITAHFALAAGFGQALIDKTYPRITNLDQLIIKIPAQNGFKTPVWIDPACEYCKVGELPYWLSDVEALVVTSKTEGLSTKAEYFGAFEAVTGQLAKSSGMKRTYRVEINKQGDMSVQTHMNCGGSDAQQKRLWLREHNTKDWQQKVEDFVKARAKGARILAHAKPKFSHKTWTSTENVEFVVPGFAVRDGERLALPLDLLRPSFGGTFTGERGRTQSIYVSFPYDFTEEIVIPLQKGWTVEGLPAPRTVRSAAFTVTIETEKRADAVILRRTLKGKMGRYSAKNHLKPIKKVFDTYRSLGKLALSIVLPKPRTAPPPEVANSQTH